MNDYKMQTRDYISSGIFALIYTAVTFVVGAITQAAITRGIEHTSKRTCVTTISFTIYDALVLVCSVFQNPRTQFFNTDTDSEIVFGLENRGVSNLSVNLGEEQILRNIKFTINSGEILGVIGANGTGKTTFARTICGLQKPSQGSITLQGKPLSEKERKRKSYMVMQDVNHQLFTESVEAECTLGIKEPDKEAVKKALELLDLTAFKERHPLSLSGGQKQRLAVAVSLLCIKR